MKENRAFTIEGAVPEDAEELVAIYDYYVQNTAITFEYEAPDKAEFARDQLKISGLSKQTFLTTVSKPGGTKYGKK